jgi:hypothetical protein
LTVAIYWISKVAAMDADEFDERFDRGDGITAEEALETMESVRARSDTAGATRESILAELAADRR